MNLNRREVLTGAASASLIMPFGAAFAANSSVSREFQATRGSSKVGSQKISLKRSGDVVSVSLRTRLNVKILGISLYRYELDSTETWEGGVLQSISGKTNDNGKKEFVEARRVSGGLDVKGSGHTGLVKGNVTSTSFFTTSLLDRSTWVSTQGGKPIKVKITKKGKATLPLAGGNVVCTHYHFGGGLNIPLDAYYDGNGDLAGYMFDAKGERARVLSASGSPTLSSVWR